MVKKNEYDILTHSDCGSRQRDEASCRPSSGEVRQSEGRDPAVCARAAHGNVPLILHPPRLSKSGYRYDVEHDGELIVVGSDDPQRDAARKLVARGISGRAETIDGKTGKLRMRFDIEAFAATRTVERNAGGISIEPWRPMPSEISHGRPRRGVSPPGGRKVADEAERPSLIGGGRSVAMSVATGGEALDAARGE